MNERHWDEEIKDLEEKILQLGKGVQKLLDDAILSLEWEHRGLAEGVMKKDQEIDAVELAVNEQCIDILALRQPMAKDLRLIVSCMRFATDMERAGDLACNVAHRAIDLGGEPLVKPIPDIQQMGGIAHQMLEKILLAFTQKDTTLAEKVRTMDDQVDQLRTRVMSELIHVMEKDPKVISRTIPLILAARHIERLCDHLTNIAEDVIYMVQARVVRHEEAGKG